MTQARRDSNFSGIFFLFAEKLVFGIFLSVLGFFSYQLRPVLPIFLHCGKRESPQSSRRGGPSWSKSSNGAAVARARSIPNAPAACSRWSARSL
jgi:hypothetical protein